MYCTNRLMDSYMQCNKWRKKYSRMIGSKGSKMIEIGMRLKTDNLYVQVCDLTIVQEAPSAEAEMH